MEWYAFSTYYWQQNGLTINYNVYVHRHGIMELYGTFITQMVNGMHLYSAFLVLPSQQSLIHLHTLVAEAAIATCLPRALTTSTMRKGPTWGSVSCPWTLSPVQGNPGIELPTFQIVDLPVSYGISSFLSFTDTTYNVCTESRKEMI